MNGRFAGKVVIVTGAGTPRLRWPSWRWMTSTSGTMLPGGAPVACPFAWRQLRQ